MKLLRVLIASVFALSSVTVHAESTTKSEAAPVATTELTAEQKKEYKSHLKQAVKELNKAGNLKGFLKNFSDKFNPESAKQLQEIFAEYGIKETDAFPKCSVKNLSVMCGNQTLQITATDSIKLNGKIDYKYEKDSTFIKVMTDIIQVTKVDSTEKSGLLRVIVPEAHAFIDGFWGGALIGALVGWLVLPKLFGGDDKKKEVHHHQYFNSPPVQPVDGGVDYSGKVNKATKAKTKEKANK